MRQQLQHRLKPAVNLTTASADMHQWREYREKRVLGGIGKLKRPTHNTRLCTAAAVPENLLISRFTL